MSSQLKEKQQQTDNKHEFEADQLFNQHLFKTLAYAGAGFGAGLVASLFVKNRKLMTLAGAGAGAAYGGQGFMNDLSHFRQFKDVKNQGQQSNILKKDDQTVSKNWEQFKPKEESQHEQKRFGGSDDSDNNESKSKSSQNKSSDSTIANTKRDSPFTTSNSHNKDDDKGSYEFWKNQGQNAKSSSHDRTNDKSSQQFGENRSSSSRDSHNESDKTSQQSGSKKSSESKVPSHHKEHEQSSHSQQKTETHSSSSSAKVPERKESGKVESKSDKKGEGQQLQDFKSNPYEAGKPAPEDSKTHRGSERPRNVDNSLENQRNQTSRSEQDRWGESKTTGNKMQLEAPSETKAGNQFNATGLTAKSQVNTVLE